MGWSKTSDGQVEYQYMEKVTNLSGESNSIILYAIWEMDLQTVKVTVKMTEETEYIKKSFIW